MDDEWVLLPMKELSAKSIVKFVPNIALTPPEELTAPPDFDSITDRISSEEGRIKDEMKISSLYTLRDEVYTTRQERFHWDLDTAVEETGVDRTDGRPIAGCDIPSTQSAQMEYELQSFVAVMATSADSDVHMDFWIGRIVEVLLGVGRSVRGLKVQWYQFYHCRDIYRAKYKPMVIRTNVNGKTQTSPWTDIISPDSVLVKFSDLTNDKRLPLNVSTSLREELTADKRRR